MAIATAGVGLLGGAAKFFEGQAQQNKAQAAIDKFRFSELQNPYKSQRVSTIGADRQLEQASQQSATALEALRESGVRGVIGGTPQVLSQGQQLTQGITADLDRQQKQLDLAAAQQDVRNQELRRQAETQELAGFGQQMNVGMGMKYGGLSNLANVAGFAAQQDWGKQADSWTAGLFKGSN